jgi:hypothetical protein
MRYTMSLFADTCTVDYLKLLYLSKCASVHTPQPLKSKFERDTKERNLEIEKKWYTVY